MFRLILCFLVSVLATGMATGQVSKRADRERTIERSRELLETSDPQSQAPLEAFAELRYPFALPIRQPVQVARNDDGDQEEVVEEQPPVVKEVDPSEVLRAFRQRLRVTGVIQTGGRSVLVTSNGPRLSAGQGIRFNHEGNSYTIVVDSVSDDAYTLRLDETTQTAQIDPDAGRGTTRGSGGNPQ
ncbi:MAG: hypothetical protein ACFB21_07995 [Opitutales bacterium]